MLYCCARDNKEELWWCYCCKERAKTYLNSPGIPCHTTHKRISAFLFTFCQIHENLGSDLWIRMSFTHGCSQDLSEVVAAKKGSNYLNSSGMMWISSYLISTQYPPVFAVGCMFHFCLQMDMDWNAGTSSWPGAWQLIIHHRLASDFCGGCVQELIFTPVSVMPTM